ncbi:VanZ family protein [Mangrovimonas aestuarii]|uniref:VanZ family protein n=1 Tax=Mangrovimonas aestuarii TaxID=3018443 RepID=UPI00237954C8|nr:VanZ family protein [Mangrovimonas aestuarii]
MIIKSLSALKKLSIFIVACYTVALATVSLLNISNLPKITENNSDKIYHLVAYAILMVLWFNALFYRIGLKRGKALLFAAIISIVFGIIIEVLQDTATDVRQADILDFVANFIGVVVGGLFIILRKRLNMKK